MLLYVYLLPSQTPQEIKRLKGVLTRSLKDVEHRMVTDLSQCSLPGRILFAMALGDDGLNFSYLRLLAQLRRTDFSLKGAVAGIMVDGQGGLYTKSTGVQLAMALNQAGCGLVGRPLVEATGNLQNFNTQAQVLDCKPLEAYEVATKDLISRLIAPSSDKKNPLKPRLLAVHASSHDVSNSLSLWQETKQRLTPFLDCGEIGLRNGTISDCSGCPYTTCLHFGEKDTCFYGGVMSDLAFPALKAADALLMICPNYNDAISANLSAFINRLTALFRQTPFFDKALFSIVVSGYSGGDIVANQLISALCMNKSFYLPPHFALIETANAPNEALLLPGIEERLDRFSHGIIETLCIGHL